MQSSTATVDIADFRQLSGDEARGSFAALQLLSRRLGHGIVHEVSTFERERACWPTPHESGADRGISEGPVFGCVANSSGLVHDVGNLMGALSLYVELLTLPGVLYEDYRDYAKDLRLLSQRSSSLMARLVAQPPRPQNNEAFVLLTDVTQRMKGLLRRIAGQEIVLDFGFGCDRPIQVSVEAVERILTNLVKNAGESMEPGGVITIGIHGSGEIEDPRIVLTVADQGRGMSAVELSRHGQSHRPREDGRGLGLRVVRELVAISDGMMSIVSEPAKGTTVTVEWPVVQQVTLESHRTTPTASR